MNALTENGDRYRQLLLVGVAVLAMIFVTQMNSSDKRFDVRSISATDAKRLLDDGALVVDVRGKEAYDGRHIPGAISIPLDTLRHAIPISLSRSIAKPMVVYCGDGVAIGPEGTSLLNKAGYSKAVNLEHGIQGWADSGLPVIKSAGSGA